ncbi:MAG: polysaccharide pyruvyl transferase family protein [Deltaproteobacteria bacterium]|nr:MAG: polysaccharide pyruvyl transferase family protein [Deltaproteobacteria bacterium]TMQ06376.1 MAG: polysaccharide pyruvyl transferase family protein [Deltaproteobacteria bacterium]
MADPRVAAFWCRIPSRPNFGDALTPWLIERITGRYPRFVAADDARPKILVVGSIIGYADASCTVWGSGIIDRRDTIGRGARLLAVRGPLTRARALACGVPCPEVYGDPALLLPRWYRPQAPVAHELGLIAHFADRPRLGDAWQRIAALRVIDIQDPIASVIDQIAGCARIASSSLHGIIAAHAYGIPAVWIKFADLPSGDDSKFHDYYLSIGRPPPAPLRLHYAEPDAAAIARAPAEPPGGLDLDPLWRACPFRGAA